MTNNRRWAAGDERGAVLVHVAVAMLALISFSALAVDYGAFWASRRQAQNAADSAALSGAISLAFVAPDDVARAKAAAVAAGVVNQVWGAAPSITETDVQLIKPCPPGAPGLPDTCLRANVYLTGSKAVPTFFAQMFGINSQDVRATATAQVATSNAAECLKPWAVADKWDQNWESGKPFDGSWTPDAVFDKYERNGKEWLPDPKVITPDVYTAPDANGPGTGFTPFDAKGQPTPEYGLEMTLKIGSSEDRLSSGWFQALALPNADGSKSSGGDDYRNNIANCNSGVFKIGESIPTEQGDMVGPTDQGVKDLLALDKGATWNASTRSVEGSCAPGVCGDKQYHARSPRIVAIPLFDIDAFFTSAPTGKTSVTITNIMGFFIEGMAGKGNKDVVGRLVAIPGLTKGSGNVDESASFLRHVMLVR